MYEEIQIFSLPKMLLCSLFNPNYLLNFSFLDPFIVFTKSYIHLLYNIKANFHENQFFIPEQSICSECLCLVFHGSIKYMCTLSVTFLSTPFSLSCLAPQSLS